MRRVERCIAKPNACVVYPQLGQAHRKGYFDTGNELNALDPHIYVSVEAVETMARDLGWVTPEGHAGTVEDLKVCRERIAELEVQLEKFEGVFEAFDTLESAGFRARRKAGRPAKSPERSQ